MIHWYYSRNCLSPIIQCIQTTQIDVSLLWIEGCKVENVRFSRTWRRSLFIVASCLRHPSRPATRSLLAWWVNLLNQCLQSLGTSGHLTQIEPGLEPFNWIVRLRRGKRTRSSLRAPNFLPSVLAPFTLSILIPFLTLPLPIILAPSLLFTSSVYRGMSLPDPDGIGFKSN